MRTSKSHGVNGIQHLAFLLLIFKVKRSNVPIYPCHTHAAFLIRSVTFGATGIHTTLGIRATLTCRGHCILHDPFGGGYDWDFSISCFFNIKLEVDLE